MTDKRRDIPEEQLEEIKPFDTEAPDGELKGIGSSALPVKTNAQLVRFNALNTKNRPFETNEASLKAFASGKTMKAAQAGQLRLAMAADDLTGADFTPSTQRTFTVLNALATTANYDFSKRNADGVLRVQAPLSFFKELYGFTNRRALERSLKADIRALRLAYFTQEYGDVAFYDIPMAGGLCGIDEGRGDNRNVYFTISPDFMRFFFSKASSVMPIDKELFAVDLQKYPSSFTMGVKLYSQRWSNPEQDVIRLSVKALLEATPTIKTEDEVKDRNYQKHIMKPFTDALNHLVDKGVLKYWNYCHEKGASLTEEEYATMLDDEGEYTKPLKWAIAKRAYIEYELAYAHEDFRKQRLEGRRAQAEGQKKLKA